ncbi:ribosome assembly factor SBDS [Candidatus Pacearchaeota archaeon CG10_big_fil_rev_8_21_14_0_10_34_76]|nr:MAG: ribosome assembly factor SBDS [Candidatus Pacearchaeota archaeon CG10_big_fil_rev_8_21_14_0_10_34_76]
MTIVVARIKAKGNHFEISVDFDEAMKVRKGEGDITKALNSNGIYKDVNKGTAPSNSDLMDAFGTTDLYEIAKEIIIKGEVQKPQEFRDAEREAKVKQVINLILRNAVDQHGRPYTEERIRRAVDEAHYSFDNKPVEVQMQALVHRLKEVIPIRIETKKLRLTIPARFTGQAYGLVGDYKEKEEWLSNGDLQVVINIPAGMQMDFFEKLNSVTHGALQSEEIKE